MNYSQSDLNKVSKYAIRLRKSFKNNELIRTKEYYDHFKYHIQLGGLEGENNKTDVLAEKFKILDKIINNLKEDNNKYKNYNTLNDDLTKCQTEKEDLNSRIVELTKKNSDLENKLKDSVSNIKTIEQIKSEKNESETELNNQIRSLNEKISKLEQNNNNVEKLIEILNIIDDKKDLTLANISTKSENLKKKMTNYQTIITKIKKNLNNNDIDFDNEKIEEGVKELEKRLNNSKKLNSELETAKQQIELLNKSNEECAIIKTELDNNKSRLNELNDQIIQKEITIKELKEQNEQLTKEKKSNELQINNLASEFESKLKELLVTIYGNNNLVEAIYTGNKLNDTVK